MKLTCFICNKELDADALVRHLQSPGNHTATEVKLTYERITNGRGKNRRKLQKKAGVAGSQRSEVPGLPEAQATDYRDEYREGVPDTLSDSGPDLQRRAPKAVPAAAVDIAKL